ncbi:hypothetical protein F511_10161 [Dorcoceras hygrometricum]|uniref:Uncharacterized protein n=1 Tax=Dorcoceras hygrometricum TaxID=472368 RepID=A0A2Z7D8Z1_9LAMI|nr:hypothetical protein F511_10161 [Dorcoceras hygrometricum]
MAHAALVSLARTLKLVWGGDQLIDRVFGGANRNIESLYGKIVDLQTFLEDFPEKYAPSVRRFETDIKICCQKLEDLIESFVTLTGTVLPGLGDTEERNSLVQILDTHIADIKSLIEYVDSIIEVATKIKRICKEDVPANTYTSSSSSTSSLRRSRPTGQETIVGVNDDLNKIKDRVTNDELNLCFIHVIGTGGIGKTTLARNVYEDPVVEQQFDVRFWVMITQEYHIVKILQGLLPKQGPTSEEPAQEFNELERKLQEPVEKRYLIVLDDMWHGEVWNRIRRAFPDDRIGSRVIVTTRLSDVAAAVDSSSTLHQMQFLNEDQSWTLLREKVYGQEPCVHELEEVGKIIARNCKGLPLTLVVIAGLLKANKTKDYWESVAKNINEAIARNDDEFFAILSLSYDNLPHHLKACFLYMGIFPEDYRIPINKLIKLWVAEGFIRPKGSKSLEELAEEYLEDLVNRSLVLVTKKRSNGKIRFCGIHDVLREFTIQRGHEENFLQHYRYGYTGKLNLPKIPSMLRRLIVNTAGVDSLMDDIYESPLRSLLYFSLYRTGFTTFTSMFLLLRVVDGLKIKAKGFPDQILNLVNLRYLALMYKYTKSCYIPAAISKLENLETLIVNKKSDDYISRMCNLFMPSEIWKMPQLRHLVVYRMIILPYPEGEELGESYSILHNMQTLHVTNLSFTMEVIERLPNLKKLRINYFQPSHELSPTYYTSNFLYLYQLEELNLESGGIDFVQNTSLFPQNLKKLTLKGCRISWEIMSVVASLPYLEVLKLMKNSFIGREWEVTEEFSSLKHLEMESIGLEDWILESNHFPCLEKLIIRWCDKLKEVPESIGDIATLKKLTVKKCNFDVEESVRKIQEQQWDLGNDDLKVHIVSMHS